MVTENSIEIGGYMPLELGYLGERENEPFCNIDEKNKIRFNAARYAICYAVQEGKFKKIYIPLYMCISIGETLARYGIKYETYSIDDEFFPIMRKNEDDTCILICNYYGIQGEYFYQRCLNRYRNIIFDNTQALYQYPIMDDGIYNVYSPRKFVGCIDGAYLIKKDIEKKQLPVSQSWGKGSFLLKSLEGGTNYAYTDYLQSEGTITKEGMCSMSSFTQKYLSSIEYDRLQEKRKLNYQFLYKKLNDYNKLHIQNGRDLCPMVYPLLPKNRIDRKILIQMKIYIPQWWKWVINQEKATRWEIELSQSLLPLPIDHRYNEKEMQILTKIIQDLF